MRDDWLQRCFQKAKKPVLTIKTPGGRAAPPAGRAAVRVEYAARVRSWSPSAPMSRYEAEEVIEMPGDSGEPGREREAADDAEQEGLVTE